MKTTQKCAHVLAATEIRVKLKRAFPQTKFKVRSWSFMMANSVTVSWINGPSYEAINSLIKMYQYSSLSERNENIPQNQLLEIERDFSRSWCDAKKFELADRFKIENLDNESEWQNKTGYWSDVAIYQELNGNRIKEL